MNVTESLYAATAAEILRSVELGCRVFYFGGFGEFDDLCYRIVSKIREERPELSLKRVYCVPQERQLRKPSHYRKEDYEEIVYLIPAFEGWYKSIYFRNCAMIDASAVVIFYAEVRKKSGAYKAYLYADAKKGKRIVNLIKA